MRKLLIAFLSIILLGTVGANTIEVSSDKKTNLPKYFRDVSKSSKLNEAIDSAISREILSKGSFFRPSEYAPAKMFWEMVLKDSGFYPEENTFEIFADKALEEDLISTEKYNNLDDFSEVTKLEAIKTLIKTKGIIPPRRISQKFRGIFQKSDETDEGVMRYIEAAEASGIFSAGELNFFEPSESVTRRELVSWIYNYLNNGTRQSKLEADKSFLWNKRSFGRSSKKNLKLNFNNEKKEKSSENLTIKILKNKDLEKISSESKYSFPGETIINEVYNEIMSTYQFSEELNEEKRQNLIDASLEALVEELGDKYSSYIKPAKSDQFNKKLEGEFEGIGAYVEMIDGDFTIIAPIGGSPAEKYGLVAGDIVKKVDNIDVSEKNIREIVDLIMGPAGTKVELTIYRDNISRDFVITRDKIIEPAVVLKWKKSVPVIEIHQFSHATIGLIEAALEEILSKNVRGIVIDLRNNPGGFLDSAVDVGSLFLKEGEDIFFMKNKEKTTPFVSKKDGVLAGFKNIVVLQNGGTASSSEILIGMLQDYGKAKVIGTKSLGKGTVQNVRTLQNGGLLKLTISKWLTPKKRWLHETGIVPEIEIPDPTMEDKKRKIDRQLDAAVNAVLRR